VLQVLQYVTYITYERSTKFVIWNKFELLTVRGSAAIQRAEDLLGNITYLPV